MCGAIVVESQRISAMRDAARPVQAGPQGSASALIAILGAATVASVWVMQARGYTPCELCLKERVPLYAGVPLAAAMAFLAPRLPRAAARAGFAALVLIFSAGAALGAYHAGVEWKLWTGPTGCSGAAAAPAAVSDFLRQLDSVTVVRCDEAALQVWGLSLAAWNAILSAGLAAVAAFGWRRTGR